MLDSLSLRETWPRSPRVALLLDNPYRDLPGMALLAMYMTMHGVKAFLVPTYYSRSELFALEPDYVLMNYLRMNNEMTVSGLMEAGIRVGILDTEGGVWPSLDIYATPMARNKVVRFAVDDFFSWGNIIADHAVSEEWYKPDQVKVTGHPRFDLSTPMWREAALSYSNYVSEFQQPLVLINMNFSLANPQILTPDRNVSSWVNKQGFDRGQVLTWLQLQEEAMGMMVHLVNQLAECYPHVNFVVRPHPFEKMDTYCEMLANRPNLHLQQKGTVEGWILRSSVVIQRSCSTAIDSMITGTPSLSPQWIPTAMYQDAAERVSIPCADLTELTWWMEEAINGEISIPQTVQDNYTQVINDWFFKMDGLSHQRIGEGILKTLKTKGLPDIDQDRCLKGLQGHYGNRVWWKQAIYDTLDQVGLRSIYNMAVDLKYSRRNLRWTQNFHYFNVNHVTEIVQHLESKFQDIYGGSVADIIISTPMKLGEYRFGFRGNKSIVLAPKQTK